MDFLRATLGRIIRVGQNFTHITLQSGQVLKPMMWHELDRRQRIGCIICGASLLSLIVMAVPIVLNYIQGSVISVDALAAWAYGVMMSVYLDRYFVSLVSNLFIRLLVGLSVMALVALVGHSMQSSDVIFIGFPNKWVFVVMAILLAGTELLISSRGMSATVPKRRHGRWRRSRRRR